MYEYNAKTLRVVDGDTVAAMIDLGFDTWKKIRIRMHGINAPESRTRDLEEKKRGLAAKARLTELLEDADNKFKQKQNFGKQSLSSLSTKIPHPPTPIATTSGVVTTSIQSTSGVATQMVSVPSSQPSDTLTSVKDATKISDSISTTTLATT